MTLSPIKSTKYKYRLLEHTVRSTATGHTVTYGISAQIFTDGKWIDHICVWNISADKQAVMSLIDDCNKYELDAIHLLDVVDDRMTSF